MAQAILDKPRAAVIYKGKILPGKSVEVEPALKIRDGRCFLLPEQAKLVEIIRYDHSTGNGYQRRLSKVRVNQIVNDLAGKKESDYPEIFIANVSGTYQCVDGQHRLMAHIDAKVPIAARVQTMSQKKAIELFVRDNSKARKLYRSELIKASKSPRAMLIKEISKDYGISHNQSSSILQGLDLDSTFNFNLSSNEYFTEKQKTAARKILDIWTADSRWIPQSEERIRRVRRDGLYMMPTNSAFSSQTTLYVLGRICREHLEERDFISRIKTDINAVKNGDWARNASKSLRGLQGGTNVHRKALMIFIQTEILLKALRD
jgi:hypothetical protein